MKLAKRYSVLVVVLLLLSLVVVGAAPPVAGASDGLAVANSSSLATAAKPARPVGAKTPPVVTIVAPGSGAEVTGTITIQAIVTDDDGIKKVEYAIDGGDWIKMTKIGGDTYEAIYEAIWDSTTVADGDHTIAVRATDTRNSKAEVSVTVTTDNGGVPPPPPTTYELFVEIDYMAGHAPTPEVLEYIEWYYLGNNPSGDMITVTFIEGDMIPLTGEYYDAGNGISEAEFWTLEAAYNDGADNADGNANNGVYDSKDKWVLYGTSVEGNSGVVGYCYVILQGRLYQDGLAGNYIFIADGTADSIEDYGAEAVVLMHEMGHSIGIGKFRLNREIYDPDTGSVMSYVSLANAGLYDSWYYSDSYWDTRNLEYYIAS